MSIISSNHRLVKISYDSDQYSAGSGIDITNKVISLDPNVSAAIDNKLDTSSFSSYSATIDDELQYVSANAGKTYSGIAPIVVNNTTNEISADSQDISFGTGLNFTNGVLSVTAHSGDPEVESVVRTNSADWGTITAFSSTSSVLNNQVTALRHDLITVITNTGYLYNDLQTTSGILSGAIDYVSSNMPDGFTGVNHDNNLSGDGKSIPLGLASSFQLVDTSIYTTATYGGSVSIEGLMPRLQLKKTNSSYNTLGEGGMTVTHPASSVGGGYTTCHYGEKMSLSYNDGDYYLHSMDTTKSGLGVTYRGAPNVKAYYNYSGVALTNDNGATNEYVNVDSIRNWNSVYDTVEANSGSWTGGGSTADPSEYSPYFLALSSISGTVGSGNRVDFGGWTFGQNAKADNWGASFGKNVTGASNSFACGTNSNAGGLSLAVGLHTEAITSCIAVGNTNKANYYSIAVGNNASAIDYSLAVGLHTSAKNCAVAVGYDTSAGKYSQAFGRNVIITNTGMAIGQYNNESANAAFVIGNGTSNNARSDSFIIYHDGSVSAAGKISANGVELGAGGGGTSLTGDAQGAVDEVYTNSAHWNDNYSTVTANSASWGGTPLPMSAGEGIDIQIENDTLVISATGGAGNPEVPAYNETLLYEGTTAAKVPQSSISLSEPANKFERLDIIYKDRYLNITDNKTVYTSNITFDNGNDSRVFISAPFLFNSSTPMYIRGTQYKFSNYTTMTFETNNLIQVTTSGLKCNFSTTPDNNGCYVWKVIGINRINNA